MSYLHFDYSNKMTTTSIEGFLISRYGDELALKTPDECVEMAINYIFDFDFPFYSSITEDLNTFKELFVRKYYQYNIGLETFGQFKFYLKEKLMEYMPKYQYLYDTTTYIHNPLINLMRVRQSENTYSNNTSSTGQNSSQSTRTPNLVYQDDNLNQTLNSDMPSYNFAAANYASDMSQNQALNKRSETGTDKNVTNGTGSSTTNGSGNGRDKETEYGFTGSQSEELRKYRELLININKMLIDDLAGLFLLMEV